MKRPSERLHACLMVAPTVLLFVGIALFPLLAATWLSFSRSILVFGEPQPAGLANYQFLIRDPRFHDALGTTAYFTFVAVTIELVLALPVALLLHHAQRARGFLRVAVLMPWVIPTVVSAKLWAWLFNVDYGLINQLLPGGNVNWLGTPALALHAAIVVDVWKTTPFVAILLLAGLQNIPADVFRAARIDGASPLRIFVFITLPLLRPALLLALLFRTLDAFRVFDAIYVLTEGGPANSTETLSIYAYKTMMRSGNFGYGSSLSVATFLCVMSLALIYIWLLGQSEDGR